TGVWQAQAHAAGDVLPRGVVHFLGQRSDGGDLSVVPLFVEISRAHERVNVIVRVVIGLHRHLPELHGDLGIHRALQRGEDVAIAVSVEGAAVDRHANLAPYVAGANVH